MATFEQLDALGSGELHDRAVSRAERHLDVKFFWRLLEAVPVAEAARGDVGEADADVQRASVLLADAADQSPGLKDALRPVYIDYLLKHDDA
ncbi:MAG: hypothetical protein ACR2HC_01655 [Thermoleophilaceae bacterium]